MAKAKKFPAGWKWTPNTRVREVTPEEALLQAMRSSQAGSWKVERQGGRLMPSAWWEVSSHSSEEAALAAKAKLDQKILRGAV